MSGMLYDTMFNVNIKRMENGLGLHWRSKQDKEAMFTIEKTVLLIICSDDLYCTLIQIHIYIRLGK